MNNIDFSDFFIMFSCRDSVCSTLPPQFIPFPHALLISSSHWILLFIHIRWWTCTTKKEKKKRTTTTTTRRCQWCFAYVCSAYEWKLLVKLKYTETFSERLDLTILECSGPKESQDYWMHYPVRWVLLSVLSIFEACLSWRESSVLGSASGY